jgi:hypothetical protein
MAHGGLCGDKFPHQKPLAFKFDSGSHALWGRDWPALLIVIWSPRLLSTGEIRTPDTSDSQALTLVVHVLICVLRDTVFPCKAMSSWAKSFSPEDMLIFGRKIMGNKGRTAIQRVWSQHDTV